MRVVIGEKAKKDLLVSLFHMLKNCTSVVSANFNKNSLHIQGMDKSHICLFDVTIKNSWFKEFVVETETNISFDANVFHLIIGTKSDAHTIIIYSDDSDNLNIDLITNESSKGDFNKRFKLPLVEYDYEEMNIPVVDYDAEFSVSSKKICEITSQMSAFGTDINIKCNEDAIDLITNGITGEMLVNIDIDDLNEYSIVEGEEINLLYSLNYVSKMCLTNKLSNEIEFFISKDFPMKIKYNLGDDSNLLFFIAPKVSD
jgi:proliferating cell nuclear antigen PCNA